MRYTFIGLRTDDRRIDVEVHGRSMEFKGKPAVIGLILDITQRRQAEAARLAEAALRLTATVFEAQEGMVVTDTERRILRANRAFSDCTGYAVEEALGRPIFDLLQSGKQGVTFYEALWSVVDHNGSWQGEIWSKRQQGEEYPGWMTIATVRDSDGTQTHYVVTLTDITERKRLESQMARRIDELHRLNVRLEETQTQLLQAEKLSAGIAHEINNPIGIVTSNLGTLKTYMTNSLRLVDAYRLAATAMPATEPSSQQAQRICDEIDLEFMREDAVALLDESKSGLERVKRIVADLQEFSRVGESTWHAVDVLKCLDNTLGVISSELRGKKTVVKSYGELPEIRGMPFPLNQVFMNLLLNAAQATRTPGTITLRTGSEAETIWVEIEDDGIGIPPENIKRIFEPFFTTKPVGTGTGLGLSVSYGIVQQHGGNITVRSTFGTGSTFRAILPIKPLAEQPTK